MEKRERDLIMKELQDRIEMAADLDGYDALLALENFYEWFLEMFVY